MSNEKEQAILTEGEIIAQFEHDTAEKEDVLKPVILVCGKSGTGKSTLINAILGVNLQTGVGKPVTQGYAKETNGQITVWDSKGLETDIGVEKFIEGYHEFIEETRSSGVEGVEGHINAHWYVIDGGGARIEDAELDIINEFPKESTIVIFSKSDKMDEATRNEFENIIRKNGNDKIVYTTKPMDIEELRRLNAPTVSYLKEDGKTDEEIDKILGDKFQKETNYKQLMELTASFMDEATKRVFYEAQHIDLDKAIQMIEGKEGVANAIVLSTATGSAAVGAIPIPGSDAYIITTAQMTMIAGLAKLYGIGIQKEQVAPMLATIAGRQAVVSLSKFIPIAGSIISAGVAGTLTLGMGQYVKSQFKKVAIAKAKGEIFDLGTAFSSSGFNEFFAQNKDLIEAAFKSAKK